MKKLALTILGLGMCVVFASATAEAAGKGNGSANSAANSQGLGVAAGQSSVGAPASPSSLINGNSSTPATAPGLSFQPTVGDDELKVQRRILTLPF